MLQQIIPGGQIDAATSKEMHDAVGHKFDSFIRDFYRGKSYVEYASAIQTPASTFTLPDLMESGYSWSLKIVAVQLSAPGSFAIYPSESTTVPSIGVSAPSVAIGGNNEAAIFWSANQAVYKDQRRFLLVASAGNIVSWRIKAEQVPTEMQGKF